MSEGIDQLQQILRHATSPKHRDKRPFWERSQLELGVRLPVEWCSFAEVYGSGTIRTAPNDRSYTWIYNPLSPRFSYQVKKACKAQNDLAAAVGEPIGVYPVYPEPTGYFPIGEDDWENTFWFQMNGDVEQWPIYIWQVALDRVHRVNLRLDSFLHRLLLGELGIGSYSDRPSSFVFVPDRPT